ncbi:hypothetical protein V2H45_10990 [Tumidithrix elongata RA019]|uniref:Uncharacterized protein n=1 Tax=Tumidithrix elongata BACA0141 TaxID=2716417 RepID=A0AAW9PZ95_9CYAN|nr:hypothetical protein [Tumidithrix elongata RA019]
MSIQPIPSIYKKYTRSLALSIATGLLLLLPTQSVKSAEQTTKNPYPNEVVNTFMKGCQITNDKSFCSCSLDKLQTTYTFENFRKIDAEARETKKLPNEVLEIFTSCQAKHTNNTSN